MGVKSSEDAIEQFLAAQRPWVRKFLQGDFALTPGEQSDFQSTDWPKVFGKARDEYLELLRKYPQKLREYRKRIAKQGKMSALWDVPKLPAGAPRKDWLAQEASALQREGLSHGEIADELNKRHPNLADRKGNARSITPEVVRKQLASHRSRKSPEKI